MNMHKEFFARLTGGQKRQLKRDAERAKAALEKRGWTRGTLENYNGEVCALGAVYYGVYGKTALGYREHTIPKDDRVTLLGEAIERIINDRGYGCSVPTYNDSIAKRKNQITTLFDRVAKLSTE